MSKFQLFRMNGICLVAISILIKFDIYVLTTIENYEYNLLCIDFD